MKKTIYIEQETYDVLKRLKDVTGISYDIIILKSIEIAVTTLKEDSKDAQNSEQ